MGTVGYVLMGFPRVSETFIASELRRVEQAGVRVRLFVIKPVEERERDHQHPVVDAVEAQPEYLPDGASLTAFRRFCEAAIERRPIEIFGHGRQTRDFTFVADIVAATRAAAEADGVAGEVLNVGGGSRVSLNSTLEHLSAIAGRPLDVRRKAREDGDVLHTGADIARARELLGYAPSTTLADGLRAEFEWALAARPAATPSAAARS